MKELNAAQVSLLNFISLILDMDSEQMFRPIRTFALKVYEELTLKQISDTIEVFFMGDDELSMIHPAINKEDLQKVILFFGSLLVKDFLKSSVEKSD